MTRYLDLVREIGEISRQQCHPECGIYMHRRETAAFLNILITHPELACGIADVASRLKNSNSSPPDSSSSGSDSSSDSGATGISNG